MNIFVTSQCPKESAIVLPDKHVVKMPLESCQMLALVASDWFYGYGPLVKSNGDFYSTIRGAFRNHPCTQWAAESVNNSAWLLQHGLALCDEYEYRYGKIHSCRATLLGAREIFPTGDPSKATSFARAMPDELKQNNSITTFEAYRQYIASKPWAADNYLRAPERRPDWI